MNVGQKVENYMYDITRLVTFLFLYVDNFLANT